MKAIILAAGKGVRMNPLTHRLPKPMIPILGKPVMEYMVEELSRHDFRQIMVNVSHLPEHIESYFGDGRRWGVEIGYSFEGHVKGGELVGEPIGSAGGIKRIQEFGGFFDDTFLVICGDALIDLDLSAALQQHWKSGAIASVMTLNVAREKVPGYGVVVCDETGRISSFQEKPSVKEAKSTMINTGVYIFEPEVIDLIPAGVKFDIGSQLFPKMVAQNLPFNAICMPFGWIDIGRIADYWEANQLLMQGHVKHINIPGREVVPGVWTGLNTRVDWDNVHIEGPVYIGASSRIDAGCEIIGPTWIGDGCHLQSGATVTRSILFGHTSIGSRGSVAEAVVFGKNCVDAKGHSTTQWGDSKIDWVGDARDPDSLDFKAA